MVMIFLFKEHEDVCQWTSEEQYQRNEKEIAQHKESRSM